MPASSTSPHTAVLPAAPSPPQPAPTQPPPSGQAQPCLSEYARMINAVKPKPVICKKKAGQYNYFDHLYLYLYTNRATIDFTG
jgi:hypothetical protein